MSLFDLWKIERKERNKRQSQTNEESGSSNTRKEKYEESSVRRFKQAWNEEFPRVKFDEIKNYMFCTVCQKHPSVCDKSSSFFGVLTVHHPPVFVVTP